MQPILILSDVLELAGQNSTKPPPSVLDPGWVCVWPCSSVHMLGSTAFAGSLLQSLLPPFAGNAVHAPPAQWAPGREPPEAPGVALPCQTVPGIRGQPRTLSGAPARALGQAAKGRWEPMAWERLSITTASAFPALTSLPARCQAISDCSTSLLRKYWP